MLQWYCSIAFARTRLADVCQNHVNDVTRHLCVESFCDLNQTTIVLNLILLGSIYLRVRNRTESQTLKKLIIS
jgi:hypothetical protein